MKPEICAECGHTEEHHKNTYCGVVNCPCKKFEPKNHTEPEDLVSNVGQFDSDTSGSDNQFSWLDTIPTTSGSDDELKGNVTDNDKGYSKDEESLSDKRKELLKTLQELQPELTMTWSMVFRDIAKQDAEAVKKLIKIIRSGQFIGIRDINRIFGEALVK